MNSNKNSSKKTKVIQRKLPCPDPKCGSSDAFHIYEDGHGYCFSCNGMYPDVSKLEGASYSMNPPSYHGSSRQNSSQEYTYDYIPWRGVTAETMEKFNVQTKINEDGEPVSIGFPYGNETYKIRRLDKKDFYSVGNMSEASLFGKDLFPTGSNKSITITEGELDTLSVYQMLASGYPVVSVRSASSAKEDCLREREYLNSFERIYLCFDADEPGKKAVEAVAKLFDFNKIYVVNLEPDLKDANGYLTAGKEKQFKASWWNARKIQPETIIASLQEFDNILDKEEDKTSVPYPFPTLQRNTYGLRKGETVLFTAMEGIGKTEIIRAIEYHLLRTTESNIGIIHLEEGKSRALKGLAGYHLNTPAHLPDSPVSKEEVKNAIHDLVKKDDRLHIYSHFGSDDPSVILDTIRFMVSSCDCEYIFFDHITMAVSGLQEQDERKALDFISTRLAMMVEELDFCLILVSHVNDEGKTRGSRNISKIADLWVHLDRDQQSESEEIRNTTFLRINKNRFASYTGFGGALKFDRSTFKITEKDESKEFKVPPVETPKEKPL